MKKISPWVGLVGLIAAVVTLQPGLSQADSGAAFGSTAEATSAIVASGKNFNCWIDAGAVKCIGNNSVGQLGDGTTTARTSPVSVSGLSSGVVAIAAGDSHTCALTQAGAVRCWGLNNRGQLGDGSQVDATTPVQAVGLSSGVVRIDVGLETSCAVTITGRALCWGNNQTNGAGSTTPDANADGEFDPVLVPTEVTGLSGGVVAISVSGERTSATASVTHGCAVLQYGDVTCWGSNSDGQLGTNVAGSVSVPVAVPVGVRVVAVSVGAKHSCALTETNGVVCWGANSFGQLATGSTTSVSPGALMTIPGVQTGIVQVSAGKYTTCVVSQSGGLTCWGDNIYGILASTPTRTFVTTPVVPHSLTSGVAAISLGEFEICAVSTTGSLRCWGANEYGQTGDGYQIRSISPVNVHNAFADSNPLTGVQALGSSQWTNCAVTSSGSVKCWGYNNSGELGDGTQIGSSQPISHASLTNGVSRVEGRYFSMCALLTNGEVNCWGQNSNSQLGLGDNASTLTTRPMLTATPSTAVTGVTDLAVGQFHSCVVAGGSAMCAGRNNLGALGDGTTTLSSVLVPVFGLSSGVSKISTGFNNFSCAVLTDGTGRCWGSGANGQLGQGSTSSSSTPVTVTNLANAVDVVSGDDFSCALISDGTVQCWGRNLYGQLGDGTNTTRNTPVSVSGVSGATSIAAGPRSACAVVANGDMKCWGWNFHGIFANGTTTDSSTAVSAVGVTGLTSISMGAISTCGVFAGGAAKCWGSEQVGQLGNDRMANRPYAQHLVLALGLVASTGLPQLSLSTPTTTTTTPTTSSTTSTTVVPSSTVSDGLTNTTSDSRIDNRVYSSAPARVGPLAMLNVVRSSSLSSVTVRSITRNTCIAAGQSVVTLSVGECVVLVRSLSSREVLRRWKTTIVSTDTGHGSLVRIAPLVTFTKVSHVPQRSSLRSALLAVNNVRAALVVGHAAILTGNTMQNRILSTKRAQSVAMALRRNNKGARIHAIGVGGDIPLSRLLIESRQTVNRRAIVYYVP